MKTKLDLSLKGRSLRWVAFSTAILLLLAGCGKKEEEAAPAVVRPVKIITLEAGGLTRDISLPGQILPAVQANMAFEVPGQMTSIFVTEGQEVTRGQLLARLDPRDYQSALDAAAAQLENAQIEMERARVLYESEASSKQRLDAAESTMKVAKATFERAQKAFNDTSLIAPIDGVVARILVNDIINVQAKQDIMILQDNSQLKVTVDVPETLSIMTDPNLPYEERTARANVRVTMTAAPERSFPARITEVAMTADPVTRTYKGTVLMDRPEELNVLPGMTATVTATVSSNPTARPDAFHVPLQALVADEQGNAFVWVVNPGDMTVSRQGVKKGTIVGENIEIFAEALTEGDLVVTSGVNKLVPGQKVRKFEM